jgi:hypothetical protein
VNPMLNAFLGLVVVDLICAAGFVAAWNVFKSLVRT